MKKMHMIGNAHIDPVWLWQWQEGFQETKATFQSALDRLTEYDDFIFTSSSAALYEWIEHNDREMFEEIKRRIQEGRWVICGGWWIEPDCNIPSGESFARQGLLGQRYFEEKFGVTAKVGYNVDSFGHHGSLPQILKKSGMDAYVFMRPSPQEKGLPSRLFLWESNDGSRVTTFRIPYEYCTFGNIGRHVNLCENEFKNSFDELMCFYGVGNHGGGPTKENLNEVKELQAGRDDVEIILSSPNEYFESVKEKEHLLPVVHDDLQHHASGCYSVHSEVKKQNRESENLLLMAEKFSTISNLVTNQNYPDDYNQAWKGVLFNQFHDILAGTSIEKAYDDARDLYGEAKSIASRGMNYALQAMSWKINIEMEEGMKPIVIFNPHSWNSTVNVEVESGIFNNYQFPAEYIVENTDGNEVPVQTVRPDAKVPGRKRISFMAELPPLGYAVYKVRPTQSAKKFEAIEMTQYSLENERLRLVIDANTGGISSLYDKHKNVEVFKDVAALPCVIDDKSDAWGHGKLHFNNIIGTFKPVTIKKFEEGPVKGVIRVISKYNNSKITQDFIMYKELEQIEVKVKVDWRENCKALKLRFPTNFLQRKATYEIPFGHIVRETNGEEESMQNWLDVTGVIKESKELYGLSILNDGKYSADVTDNVASLTVLRSQIYAHHDPCTIEDAEDYSFIDHGIQTFTYVLLPHEKSWEEANTVQRALELNQRAPVIIETYHEGPLPQTDSFIKIDKDNIILSSLKKAEDNDDLIIRMYEAHHQETNVKVELPHCGRIIKLHFTPSEIKTVRIPKDINKDTMETDLIEKPYAKQSES